MHPLVTIDWLSTHLDDLVLVDATLPPVGVTPAPDTQARYLTQHLPGAVFFDIEALSRPHLRPAPHAALRRILCRRYVRTRIADTDTIVVYEQAGVFSAPRAWWMLRTFGARNVSVLDGGLTAWLAAGLPAASGTVERPAATFHATLDTHAVRDFAAMQQLIADHAQILDARSAGRFHGTAPEPRPGLRSGHMPGATSLPFTELVANGRLKPASELRDLFAAKGLDLAQPITTTVAPASPPPFWLSASNSQAHRT